MLVNFFFLHFFDLKMARGLVVSVGFFVVVCFCWSVFSLWFVVVWGWLGGFVEERWVEGDRSHCLCGFSLGFGRWVRNPWTSCILHFWGSFGVVRFIVFRGFLSEIKYRGIRVFGFLLVMLGGRGCRDSSFFVCRRNQICMGFSPLFWSCKYS